MKKTALFFALSVLAFTAGCSRDGREAKTAAAKFWDATRSGKVEAIRPLVTPASLNHEMLKADAKPVEGSYSLGEVEVGENRAVVETELTEGGKGTRLKTVLFKEEGQWKVDVDQTIGSMFEKWSGPTTPAPAAVPAKGSPRKDWAKGDPVMVEWHGAWYPSVLLEAGENRWKIHYEGYSDAWDEWVGPGRIRTAPEK